MTAKNLLTNCNNDRRKDLAGRARFQKLLENLSRDQLIGLAIESFYDPLTGLMQRRAMESLGISKDVDIAIIDIDNFKFVNDVFGHHVGDSIIMFIADGIKASGAAGGYRIGGDEFAIIGPTQQLDLAVRRIQRHATTLEVQRTALRDYAGIAQGSLLITTGIGVSIGIGSSMVEAEEALAREKEKKEKAGIRVARNDIPPGYTIVSPERLKEIYRGNVS